MAGESDGNHLIKSHFARLEERNAFDLSINVHGQLCKTNGELWTGQCVFPAPNEDILLYLALTGDKTFRPLVDANEAPVPLHQALAELEHSHPNMLRFNPATGSLKRLEAFVAGSIVLVSHVMGLGGPNVGAFLVALLYELGLGCSPCSANMRVPATVRDFRNVKLSFLAPLDVHWPAFLPVELSATLVTLKSVTTRANDRVELRTSDSLLSVDCWNPMPRMLDSEVVVKGIINRILQSSTVHLVVAD